MTTSTSVADPFASVGPILDRLGVPALVVERAPRTGSILFATCAFARVSGCSVDELLRSNLLALDVLRPSNERREHMRRALHSVSSSIVSFPTRLDGATGGYHGLLLVPLLGPDGESTAFLSLWMDRRTCLETTEFPPAVMRQIALSKAEWESTIDSLRELVLLVDSEMRVIRANRTIEQWNLGGVRTAKGRSLHDVLHPGCGGGDCLLLAHWKRLHADGASVDTVEYSDDDAFLQRRVAVTMHAVPVRRGFDEAVTVVVRDISRNYQREEFRRRQERFEAMGHLVGGLAHEIGNPLAAMRATVEVWSRNLERFDRSDHARFLSRLGAGIERMQATVDRIRTYGSQRRHVEEPVSAWPVLEEIHALFQAQATERGVDLILNAAASRDLWLTGDPSAVYEICVNVLKNAIEACGTGDRVSIDGHEQEESVIIRIADTGCGISASAMRHLFAPFFTTKPTGTGIGLAQANHLMEQMGARIDVQSTEHTGTCVTLRFRRASPPRPRPAPSADGAEPGARESELGLERPQEGRHRAQRREAEDEVL